ncbi:hypothetical protein HanRHA438_Chr00c11g0848661 [Helianthus annuus]|nr:hypothetical protein HanRHA438_Chr07g0312021 [Helianthus annuus]KAJ0954646.1 hypothetical protein HanRHA438_Chr00c11g0848661 [Helianthus annuus]
MFCPDFEGKIEIVKCGPDEEGWNETILSNFWVPDEAALNAMLLEGKGVPKVFANLVVDKQRRKKKAHVAVTLPPLVPEAAGTFHPRLRKYEDYAVVSDTLEGLSVGVGSSVASGAIAGTKPVDDKKQKGDTTDAGGEKAPKFRKTRSTAVPKHKPASSASKLLPYFATFVSALNLIVIICFVEPLEEPVSASTLPTSPPKVVDAESQKKGGEDPSIEVLEKEKAAFEKLKQTERWAASAGLEQVRSLAKLLSEERKHWKEACARENEKIFRLHQELNNLKAANAALVKEKIAGEAAVKEAEGHGAATLKEAEARAVNELADANADRTKLNKRVEELQAELKNRDIILGEVTSRATETETRARQTEEERDGLATSLAQVNNDRAWMRQHGIGHIVEAILDAPENAVVVTEMNERARQVGFRAGYDKCLNDVNLFFSNKFTDERSGFHGVDTEAAFGATIDAYNNLSIPAWIILKHVWKWKIMWTVFACCLTR